MKASEKYEKSIRKIEIVTAEKSESIIIGGKKAFKEGEEFSFIPPAKNRNELIERFKNYFAQRKFEKLIDDFEKKFGTISEAFLRSELDEIQKFTKEAGKISLTKAFENNDLQNSLDTDMCEYLRLNNDYYENPNKPISKLNSYFYNDYFNNNAASIYGKYFLYKEWLENELNEINIKKNNFESEIEQNDTRFWLTSFYEKQEQTTHIYKSLKSEIDINGCFIVQTNSNKVKIYNPELATILTSKELFAENMDTQTEVKINGKEYLKTFITAYEDGEQYFENEFKVSPNTLYGDNAEQLSIVLRLAP